jgi:hypothetical protein
VQQARGPMSRRPVGPAQPAVAAAAAANGPQRVASTQAPVRPSLLPSAPSGVAGPALASATMLIPLPGKPEAEPLAAPAPARPATPAARPAAAAISHAAGAAAGAGGGATAAVRERAAVAEEANGHYDDEDPPTEFPPPRRATPARPAAGGPPRRGAGAPPAGRPRPAGRPQPSAPLRTAAGASRALPPEEEPPHGRRRLTAVLVALVALVVVAGAVWFIAIRDTGSNAPTTRVEAPDAGTATRRAAARRTQTQRQQTPAPAHDSISVAVLNATGLTGLAGRVMGQLTAAGYPQGGVVADAGTTTAQVTIVNYRDGREAAAREVARTLGLPSDATDVMQAATDQACAANSGGTCTADVVVVVGSDLQ